MTTETPAGTTPATAAPAAPAAAAPGAPAAPAAAAAPASPATAPAPDGATPGAAAAPATGPDGNIIADAKGAAGAPAVPTKDELTKYLTDKGVKPEDLAKLNDAGLKAKHDELKAADAKTAALAAIEIKVPEGMEIEETKLAQVKEILADEALSRAELGQKLFDLHASELKAAFEEPVQLWMKTQNEWQATIKADAEIGGASLTANLAAVAKAIDSIGGKEAAAIREAFIFTGAGNNPEIVRFMVRASKALTEGGVVQGTAPGAAAGDAAAALARMYPSASDSKAAASP